jgi:acyl dehydratase
MDDVLSGDLHGEPEVRVGAQIPPLTMPITLSKLVIAAGGERDFNPIHYDVEAAKAAGVRTAFANTFFQQGILNRVVNDWTGPQGYLRRLVLSMKAPIHVGTTLVVTGTVTAIRPRDGEHADDIELTLRMSTEDGRCSEATATAVLPRGGARRKG